MTINNFLGSNLSTSNVYLLLFFGRHFRLPLPLLLSLTSTSSVTNNKELRSFRFVIDKIIKFRKRKAFN